jgi:hypothetical protein
MKTGLAMIAILLSLGADLATAGPGWRSGPQKCFLPPDVVVAVNALGPYCSSPRGRQYRITRADQFRTYNGPYYGAVYIPSCWSWAYCY